MQRIVEKKHGYASSASMSIDPALSGYDQFPDSAFVRVWVVAALHGVSIATVWRWAKNGILPQPVRLSSGTTAWKVGDLRRAKLI